MPSSAIMTNNYRPLSKNNRGPRSRKGKAAGALNNLEHGLAAAAIVLPSEDAVDWSTFHDDVLSRFAPEGAPEIALASRVAEILWRLRRVARAEQQSVSVAQMHRDTLALDREQLRPASSVDQCAATPVSDPDPCATAGRREELGEKLGFYADAMIADSAASRFRETLPVLLPDDRTLEMLVRYEAHLSRVLKHTLHELEALQDRRHGNPTPLARIDIV